MILDPGMKIPVRDPACIYSMRFRWQLVGR